MELAAAPPLTETRPASDRAELSALTRLAAPLVGANLLQMAVSAVDVIFVARLGTVDLAAATLGVFLFNLSMYALIGLTSAASPLIAAELGRRRHAVREVRRSVRMAFWVGAAAALPVLLLLAHGETLLLLAGQDPDVARRAGHFLDIILIGLLPGVAAGIMRSSAAALGRPGWAFAVTGLALLVSIVANWALVFGNLGAPALGLEGSAIASVISLTAMAIAYAAIIRFDRRLRRYHLFGRWWATEWPRFRDIIRLGVPIMLTWTFEGALFGGAAILMGLIGVNEVAAHAVALNIAAIAFQVPFGIAQAATIRVGMAYGARDRDWIARAGRVALAVGIGFMGITAAAMWAAPRLFVSAYVDVDAPANAIVVKLAVQYLALAAMFQLVDGAQAVAAGVLRGLQDTRVPMFIALFGYWVVGFGTSIFLGFEAGWAGVGIWTGLAVGLLAVSVLLMWRWYARERLGLVPRTI
ncbi:MULTISPECIES: MATE family efflux transporter [unclassified Sphingomonas]|uniref:MATE family efflux transporter n=1 Tax=unclassified Sphingomonas TaxID=196159 RepID=UPI001D1090E4|nr:MULTISPECIES: MATE family efflux transporter [unclassified Sphingomonas]MCC2979851.1 MATE family efflux transporter [Sphingomonas sp. IC4-52]MCD2314612.1 MATE family efflux transporter [Sphingomonas sp. IC-11]